MKKMVLLSSIMLCGLIAFAQNTIHGGKIVGSVAIGNKDVTTVRDVVTDCIFKSNPHPRGLFTSDEDVELSFSDNDETKAEVIKPQMPEQVFAFNKDCNPNPDPTPQSIKVHAGLGAQGLPGNSCTGTRKCGPCPGFCVRVVFSPLDPNNPPNGIDEGIIEIEIVNNKLRMIFDNDMDTEGNGKTYIDHNFPIGVEVSQQLGYKMIILKKGSYEIDYSNSQFGEAFIDAKFNKED